MELLFLGTSSGTPTKERNVTACAIKKPNNKSWCLVDCGEGTQHQILKTNLSLNHLQAIFITHVHGDHCYGLPGLIASAGLSGRKVPLKVVGPPEIEAFIKATLQLTDLYLPYELDFYDVNLLGCSADNINRCDDLQAGLDFDIEVIELSHRVVTHAYAFVENNQLIKLNAKKLSQAGIKPGPIWGEIQQGMDITLENGKKVEAKSFWLPQERPQKVIIAGDNDRPELLLKAAENADVLVHESTYTQDVADKVGPGPQHSSAKNVAQFAQSVNLKNLVLTHFSARYQNNPELPSSIKEIESEAACYFVGNLMLANDLDTLLLDKQGVLKLKR